MKKIAKLMTADRFVDYRVVYEFLPIIYTPLWYPLKPYYEEKDLEPTVRQYELVYKISEKDDEIMMLYREKR